MGYIVRTLSIGLRVIAVLRDGPYTVDEIASRTGLGRTSVYRYINSLSEVLPVRSMNRKTNVCGKNPKVFWLE